MTPALRRHSVAHDVRDLFEPTSPRWLDFGARGKFPYSVLRFPETDEMNATAFHAMAVPSAADGKHFITVLTCNAKVEADCVAALVDVVTKGPPKI